MPNQTTDMTFPIATPVQSRPFATNPTDDRPWWMPEQDLPPDDWRIPTYGLQPTQDKALREEEQR